MSLGYPDIMTPEVNLAFEALCEALDAAAKARAVTLCDVALTWHSQFKGTSGFNCCFNADLTADVAGGMAGVLLMDASDDDQTLPRVVRQ